MVANVEVATLRHIVEKVVRQGLGYGEGEFSLTSLTGRTLYDVDYDDDLDASLKELGFGSETFVTVADDDEDHDDGPRVNLVLAVTHRYANLRASASTELTTSSPGDDVITVPEGVEIPRKPRAEKDTTEDEAGARKRKLDAGLSVIEDRPLKKRAVVVVNDDGAITID